MAAAVQPGTAAGASAEQLGSALLQLRDAGADNFDPPRFHFIEALLHRAGRHGGPVGSSLLHRAEAALLDYQQQFQLARHEVAQSLDTLCEQFPQSAASLQQWVDKGKLREFKRLALSLQRPNKHRPLGELLDRLQQRDEPAASSGKAVGLEKLLLQQEQEALAATIPAAGAMVPTNGNAFRELRAARWLRKTQAGRRTRELLAEAVQGCPENSGPLNPERLAMRSLEALRGLSPEYLQHMISYIETVFTLQATAARSEERGSAGRSNGVRRRSRSRDR